ncbi:RHS repeat-associated core domain-containing protein, partial [Photorhabdus akhurstii]|uniref:RHS repeat domain-containing protein n=1 Tax=Photorhabdus akhurstii TaxID=171438 RepID=UPI002F9531BE|nr:type IV secretion protein Rhs [Photorhabdus akhurstii]
EGQAPLTLERDDAGRDTGRYVEGGFILRQQYSLMGQLTAQRAGRNPHFFRPAELEEIAGPAYAGVARRYEYDAALNLTAVSDDGQPLNYLLNGNGQVMSVGEGRTLREHYQYDETGYPSRRFDGAQEIMGETLYQEGHRLNWVGSHRFVYDRAGRMQEKQFLAEGCRLALTKYRWNSQNQLTGLITPDGIPWEYRYDAFGRRTEKRCIQSGKLTTYVWDGDVPAEIREYQHGRLKMIRHLVFDGWELIAQQTQAFTLNLDNRVELMAGEVQTQYAVSAPTGEPLALFDPEGKRVWRRPKQSLYGLRLSGHGENPPLDPGLRFAGQLFDEESGLFYNRFRYYLPEAACYLSPDPLGLNGGENPYAYVHNPANWIDPLGLAGENVFIHYTNKAGFDGIMKSGVLNPNVSGKVYITDILMSPKDVMRDLLINNPNHIGRGDYAIIFKIDPGERGNIRSPSRLEYTHEGKLKLNNILYAGKNPYTILEHLDYDTRLKLTDNQVKIRKCGGK